MGSLINKIFVKSSIVLATLIVMALAGSVIAGIHLIKFFRKFRHFNRRSSDDHVEDVPLAATERISESPNLQTHT